MAAIPPNNNLEGLISSLKDGIYGAYNKGVKYGRYLALQEYLERKEAAQPKWISVEERLPEEDTCVLAAFLYYEGYRIKTARYSVSGEKPIWLIGDMCAIGSVPAHWMPMPTPPKEDNDA